MDAAKAKSVVIVLLIAFNIFLLVNNLSNAGGQGVQKETIENAAAILKQRGVTLECGIPSTPAGVHRLEYRNGKLDREKIAQGLLGDRYDILEGGNEYISDGEKIIFTGDTSFVFTDDQSVLNNNTQSTQKNIDLRSDKKIAEGALEFLEGKGLISGRYVVDEVARNQDDSVDVVFIEDYEGLLLFDNYCAVTLTEKGVIQLIYSKLQANGFSAERTERFEAYQALLAAFKAGSTQVITDIDNGYKLEEAVMDGMESVELQPVWRVKLKGEAEPLYIGSSISEKQD